ncbi:MAG TPA: class I SAM-dependent methyltransferase [Verrucomicrobiae bacterium]|jgi:ubiquinone/menaquinone biosynthesis C-methylase UbiE
MQEQYENQYHRTESHHWWFVGRRSLVYDLTTRANPNPACRILEIGCSSGQFMAQLRQKGYQNVTGIDISEKAVKLCQDAGLAASVMDAQQLDFPDQSFDLITASDVLEHLKDEKAALQEWCRVLKPGGIVLIFVPAFMFLWSKHDVANRHYRRYRLAELKQALDANGFVVERSSYWNFSLFLPIATVRSVKRLFEKKTVGEDGGTGDLFIPREPVNSILLSILRMENCLFKYGINWPFGVSAMTIARRRP